MTPPPPDPGLITRHERVQIGFKCWNVVLSFFENLTFCPDFKWSKKCCSLVENFWPFKFWAKKWYSNGTNHLNTKLQKVLASDVCSLTEVLFVFRLVGENIILMSQALSRKLVIPEFPEFCSQLKGIFQRCAQNKEGKVASAGIFFVGGGPLKPERQFKGGSKTP
jgi:hypothetical protein